MATIKASLELRDFIKRHEAFRDKPYKDVTGKTTIGYGDTETGATSVTEAEASKNLETRIALAEAELSQVINRDDLSQGQMDALIDKHYNLGLTTLVDNRIIERVNNREDDSVLESIPRYNKALNPETNQLQEYPGLTRRAKERAEMWANKVPSANTTLTNMIESYERENMPEAQAPSLNDIIRQYEDETAQPSVEGMIGDYEESIGAVPSMNERNSMGLDSAQMAADNEQADLRSEAVKLANRLSITPEEAYDRLLNQDPNEVELSVQRDMIASNFPSTTAWAQNPDNFAIFRRDPPWAKNIEKAGMSYRRWQARQISTSYAKSSSLRRGQDFVNALKSNGYTIQEGVIQLRMALGDMDIDTGLLELNRLARMKHETLPSQEFLEGMDTISSATGDLASSYLKSIQGVTSQLEKLSSAEINEIAPILLKTLSEGGEGVDGLLSFMKVLRANPEAAVMMSAQSIGSTFGPLALGLLGRVGGFGVGAAIGYFGVPLPGAAPAGAVVGSMVGGGAVAFSQFMQEKMEEYRNDFTGQIDFEGFFRNEEIQKEMKEKAAIYGVTMGMFDVVGEKVLGKFLVPAMSTAASKGASLVAKSARMGTALTAEMAVQSFTEFSSEFMASTAVDLYDGILTMESLSNNLGKATLEAALSVPSAAPVALGGAGVKVALNKAQAMREARALKTISKKVEDTNRANESYNDAQQLRSAVEDSQLSETHPDNTEALVESVLNDDRSQARFVIDDEIDTISEQEIDGEISILENNLMKTVSIEANLWRDFWTSKGMDPEVKIREFGPEALTEYQRALGDQNTITLPHASWVVRTRGFGEIDSLAMFEDQELNAVNAVETQRQVNEELPKLYQEKTPEPELLDVTQMKPESFTDMDGNRQVVWEEPILREVAVRNRFRNEEDFNIFKGIRRNIRKALANVPEVSKEQADAITEVQFRHARMRSISTGIPLADIANSINFDSTPNEDALGTFFPSGSLAQASKIALDPEASVQTVLHELGHSWLHEMGQDWNFIHNIEDDALSMVQRQYKDAMDSTARLLGIDDLSKVSEFRDITQEEYTRIHETFAQTAERYFLENKVQSSTVSKVMEYFREWLAPIADMLGKTYSQFPALEINQEVLRLFDTLIQASDKIEEFTVPMFPEPLFDPNILGKDKARYMDAIIDSQEQAMAKVYTKSMRESFRERNEILDRALDTAYDMAEAEVNELPSMVMLNSITEAYNGFKEDKKNGIEVTDPRISFESFAEVIANGNEQDAQKIKATLNRNLITGKKKGGIPIEQFMTAMGVTSPEEMLTMLVEASNKDKIISDRAQAILREQNPILKTDEQIHAIAVEAVQNTGKEKLLQMELKILFEQYPTEFKKLVQRGMTPADMVSRLSKETIDRKGETIIGNSNALTFKSKNYLRMSNLHGRKAAKRFSVGDIVGAFESKEQEAIYFSAYKKARVVERKRAKYSLTFKKLMKMSDQKIARTRNLDIVNYAKRVLHAITRDGLTDIPNIDTRIGNLNNLMQPSQVETLNEMADDFRRYMEGRPVSDMSIKAFMRLGELVSKSMAIASAVHRVELNGRRVIIDQVATAIDTEVGARKGNDPKAENSDRWIQKFIRANTNVRSLFSGLVGQDKNTFLMTIFNKVANAEAQYNTNFDNERAKITKALRALAKKNKNMGNTAFPIQAPELNENFPSLEAVMKSLLYAGSESGLRKFLMGGFKKGVPLVGLDAVGNLNTKPYWDFINRLIKEGTLTQEHFDVLQLIWDSFSAHHEQAKVAMKYTNGINMGTIQAKSINTPWGEYKGGYIPLSEDEAYKGPSMGQDNLSVDPDNKNYTRMFPNSDIGFTKSRNENFYPLDLTFSHISNDLANLMKVAYLRQAMYDVSKVLSHPRVIEALDRRRPGAYVGIIKPWFEDVMNQQYTAPSDNPLDTVARHVRQNSNILMFLGNVGSILRQSVGLVPAIPVVGGGNLMSASRKFMLSPNAMYRKITTMSPRMAYRFRAQESNKIRSGDDLVVYASNWERVKEVTQDLTFMPMRIAQTMVDAIVWQAGYDRAVSLGMAERQAVAFADNAVEKTQTTSQISGRSTIQRGSDLQKLFLSVTSVPLAMNNLTREFMARENTNRDGAIMMGKMAIYTVLLPAILNSIISSMLDMDAEDEEAIGDKMALQLITESLEVGVPVFSRPITSFIYSGGVSVTPAQNQIRKIGTALTAVGRSNEVDMTPKEVAALMDTFSLFLGGPTPIIGRGIRFADSFTDPNEIRIRNRERRRQLKESRRD